MKRELKDYCIYKFLYYATYSESHEERIERSRKPPTPFVTSPMTNLMKRELKVLNSISGGKEL